MQPPSFLPSNIATTGTDYLPTSGALEFAPGETTKSFNVTIIEDAIPELNEYVFVAITSVELNASSVDTVDPAGKLATSVPGSSAERDTSTLCDHPHSNGPLICFYHTCTQAAWEERDVSILPRGLGMRLTTL